MPATIREAHGDSSAVDLKALRTDVKSTLERLANEVDSCLRDEGFREVLRSMARFWRYSLFNQWLIRRQRPGATRVAGRGTWASLGRRVRPGARGISIMAPSRRAGGGMRAWGVEVFDLSQTDGRPLPTLSLLADGDTELLATLEGAAARLGVAVAREPLPAGVAGLSQGGRVIVRSDLGGRAAADVLAHELAHELLHQAEGQRREELQRPGPARTRAEEETEADATAYVVLTALGLPSRAGAYIAWQGGTGLAVLRSMKRVERAARQILEAAAASPSPSVALRPARTIGTTNPA